MGGYTSYKARRVVEKFISRDLIDGNVIYNNYPDLKMHEDIDETVHHINKNLDDNRPENLYVFRNSGRHSKYHKSVINWSYGLFGKTLQERIEYLKTFPELESNLPELKRISKSEIDLMSYIEDNKS